MRIADTTFFEGQIQRKFEIVSDAERNGSTLVLTRDEPDGVFCLFAHGGARHLYGEAHKRGTALEGVLRQPGEHHSILPTNLPMPAVFLPQRRCWASHDPYLVNLLQQTEPALRFGQQSWRWYQRPGGRTYFDADWAAQLAPTDVGVHFVMRGLQPDAAFDSSNSVGMGAFLRAAATMQHALQATPRGAAQPISYPTSFGETAMTTLLDDDYWVPVPEPADVTADLVALLGPFTSDVLTLGNEDPKRAAAATAIVPIAAQQLPRVATLGATGFLAGDALLVVTPTHGFMSWKARRVSFAWTELIDAASGINTVYLRTDRLGWFPVPGCRRPEDLSTGFVTLIERWR